MFIAQLWRVGTTKSIRRTNVIMNSHLCIMLVFVCVRARARVFVFIFVYILLLLLWLLLLLQIQIDIHFDSSIFVEPIRLHCVMSKFYTFLICNSLQNLCASFSHSLYLYHVLCTTMPQHILMDFNQYHFTFFNI